MASPVTFIRYWRGRWGDFSSNARQFLALQAIAAFFGSAYGVIFNLFLMQSGYGEASIGKFLSAAGLALAITVVPCGILTDKWGHRRSFFIAAIIGSACALFRVFAPNAEMIFVFFLIGGAAGGLAAVAGAPFLMENSRAKERTDLFSVNFAIMLGAGVLGNFAGGGFPDLLQSLFNYDLQSCYMITLTVSSLGMFLGLIPILRMRKLKDHVIPEDEVEEPAQNGNKTEVHTIKPVEGKGWNIIIKFVITSALIGAGAGLVIPFFNLYFSKRFLLPSSEIGILFAVAQICTAFAALLGPALARRIGKVNTVVIMQILSLPFLVTLGFETQALWLASVAFFARATFMQAGTPLTGALQMELIPAGRRAFANSLNSLSWNLAWAGTTAISGELMERINYAIPYYITAGFYLISTVLFYIFFWRAEGITLSRSMGKGLGKGIRVVIAVPRRLFTLFTNQEK
jgi:MFS family permease